MSRVTEPVSTRHISRRCKQGRPALGTSANENGIKLSPSGVRGRGSECWGNENPENGSSDDSCG